MSESDAARLIRISVATAVHLLEQQDGLLFPIAHAVDAGGRTSFVGIYDSGVAPHPSRSLDALRNTLRTKPYHATAITYGVALADELGRHALCIEFESLDAAPETIYVPFVITRPGMRHARVVTYAPIRRPGRNLVLRPGPAVRQNEA